MVRYIELSAGNRCELEGQAHTSNTENAPDEDEHGAESQADDHQLEARREHASLRLLGPDRTLFCLRLEVWSRYQPDGLVERVAHEEFGREGYVDSDSSCLSQGSLSEDQ